MIGKNSKLMVRGDNSQMHILEGSSEAVAYISAELDQLEAFRKAPMRTGKLKRGHITLCLERSSETGAKAQIVQFISLLETQSTDGYAVAHIAQTAAQHLLDALEKSDEEHKT